MLTLWFRKTGFASRHLLAAIAAVCVLFGSLPLSRGAAAPNEDVLKAAFLFNFAQFTRWPAETPLNRPVNFCLYEDSMAGEAGASLAGKAIGGRMTRVQAIRNGELPQDCDVVYAGLDYGQEQVCAVAAEGAARGMLTVSDLDGFDACGGHITLTTINSRLRFIVNLQAVQESELNLSAQLLELAIIR